MSEKTKKIATNIPIGLLKEATSMTGLNQTAALIAGLRELIKSEKRRELLKLEGRVQIDFDIARSRGRS